MQQQVADVFEGALNIDLKDEITRETLVVEMWCSRPLTLKASRVTAGCSAIDRFLEGFEAKAAISVEETFAFFARLQILIGYSFHRIDDAVLVEAGQPTLDNGMLVVPSKPTRAMRLISLAA